MRMPALTGAALATAVLLLPSAGSGHCPDAPASARDDGSGPSLCDLVEEALLATAPQPTPVVEFAEREERRANIERIKRQVQRLRDEGRCP